MLVRAPARVANASRNAGAEMDRHRRWAPAREALWDFLAPHLDEGARVAIVGAGNGDDLPLRRIARRAGEVVLIDIDPRAAQGARRRLRRPERRKLTVVGHDVTSGAVDAIILAALGGESKQAAAAAIAPTASRDVAEQPDRRGCPADLSRPGSDGNPRPDAPPSDPLPGAPYDLVFGDLLYSQLLYPALLDLGVDADHRAATIAAHAPTLTRAVVARLHASAPRVVHLHDPLAWWDGHEQPVALDEILALAASDGPDAALSLAAQGLGPRESDPRAALVDLGLVPTATALWRWPFSDGVDYLVCATLACS
jgi:16S rRNA G966 N2-methylase RsmD